MRPRRARAAAALAAFALCIACGSTVQFKSQTLAQTNEGFGGTAGAPTARSNIIPTIAAPGTGPGSTTPANEPLITSLPGLAPGKTSTAPIRIGIVYLKGLEAAYAAVGAKASTVDSKSATQAVIDDINAHGGVLGHRLNPAYYAIDANSSTDRPTQLAAACDFFAHDHPVDIVLSYTGGAGGALVACARRYHFPLVNGYPGAGQAASAFSTNRLYFEPSEMSLDRLARLLSTSLLNRHWIDARWGSDARCAAVPGPRLGVITLDVPEWRHAYDVLASSFKSLGHPVFDVKYLNVSGNTATAVANASASAQNAVLQFSSECIDHVVFMSAPAANFLFMLNAENQGYRPRYGISSVESVLVNLGNLPNPGNQLHGSVGPGWAPFMDVEKNSFDAAARAPAQHCLDVLKRRGLTPGDNNATILALPSCDGPYFAIAMFTRWLTAPKGTDLLAAADSLGGSYRPSGTYAATLGAGHHDGATLYRDFGWIDSCECFKYTSGPHAL